MASTYLTGVTVLKQLAMTVVTAIKSDDISSQQSSHECG